MKSIPCTTLRRHRFFQALPVLFGIFLLPACAKNSLVISPPLPIPTPVPVHPITYYAAQTPFQAFITKYNVPFTETNQAITVGSVGLDEETRGVVNYNQAEIGFAFRSSVAGVVIALGTMLPTSGFSHTVTLWDSATQTILASSNVANQAGKFSYLDFATTIPIQANHGYVVGFNTLATGNAINTYSPGNWIYLVNGIYVDGGLGNDLPLFPFTEGTMTIENGFSYNYGNGRVPANLFPASSTWNSQPNIGFPGLCDVAFVQQ